MSKTRPIKILIAKCGLDGHERGALVVAQALRDAGMEVIYTGIRNTPNQVIKTAIQEDVDGIGISSLSGGHLTAFLEIADLVNKEKITDKLLFAGGIIPPSDIKELEKIGFKKIFGPGSSFTEIVDFIKKNVKS